MDSIYSTNLTSTWIINPTPSIIDSWFSINIVNGGKGRIAVTTEMLNLKIMYVQVMVVQI